MKNPAHFCQTNLPARPASAMRNKEQQIAVSLAKLYHKTILQLKLQNSHNRFYSN